MNEFRQKQSLAPLGNHAAMDNVIIAIGASTGGTEAVLSVLETLPEDMPPIIVVQHIPPEGNFTAHYAERLNGICQMNVQEAKNGDVLRRGCVYIAPADLHTRVYKSDGQYMLVCAQDEKVAEHRPSVDVLFHSMAENVTCKMIGIIMTGMGDDGAKGLLAMRRKGAYTIGQDMESCTVYGMPKKAYEIGAVVSQVPCDQIAAHLYYHLMNDRR